MIGVGSARPGDILADKRRSDSGGARRRASEREQQSHERGLRDPAPSHPEHLQQRHVSRPTYHVSSTNLRSRTCTHDNDSRHPSGALKVVAIPVAGIHVPPKLRCKLRVGGLHEASSAATSTAESEAVVM